MINKKFFLIPLVISILTFFGIIALTSGESTTAPFVYTIQTN